MRSKKEIIIDYALITLGSAMNLPGSPLVATRYVPVMASTMAMICLLLIRVCVLAATTMAIMTTLRLCSTVAVPEFEYFTDARKAYWQSRSPAMAKATRRNVSFLSLKMLKSL